MEGKRSHAIRHLSELKDTGEENLQYPEKKEKKEDKEIENEKENYCGEKKKRQKRPLSRAASTRAQVSLLSLLCLLSSPLSFFLTLSSI